MQQLTLTEYQSFLVKGSCVFFFRPFLPLDSRLFLKISLLPNSSPPTGLARSSRAEAGAEYDLLANSHAFKLTMTWLKGSMIELVKISEKVFWWRAKFKV